MMAKSASEVQAEVLSKGHVWDAFDQGRWAFHNGTPIEQNPFAIAGHVSHAYGHDWRRGWEFERESQSS